MSTYILKKAIVGPEMELSEGTIFRSDQKGKYWPYMNGEALPASLSASIVENNSTFFRKLHRYFVSWAYKTQPDWKDIQACVNKIARDGGSVRIYTIGGYSDAYTILITDDDLEQAQADKLYEQHLID
jgi:hypothetical protein